MISKVFKARFPSCNFIFKDGTKADFLFGTYATSDETKIAELMAEIKNVGKQKSVHEFLYVDENEVEIDSNAPTPIEILQRQMYEQARADLLAEAAAGGKLPESTSDTGGIAASFANTQTAAAVTAESTGAPVVVGQAKLAALAAAVKK